LGDDIFDQLKALLLERLEEDKPITSGSTFKEDLGFDSLDLVEVTMSLEEKFDISISDEEAGKLVTVGDAVEFVRSHKE